jgi:GNAT superfamily N-acetyltransferase
MVEPAFRPATDADRPELVWLEGVARDGLDGQRGADLWADAHPRQSPEWPAVTDGEVLVSTIIDVPVGYVRFSVVDAVLYVHDIFVHPEAREVGCGDGLLAAAIEVGRSRGARRIEAEALPGDRHTKNLYERAAITAKRIVVSAPLD